MSKRLSAIHYTVFTLIALSILMQTVYFLKTGTFDSPIIAFEFAENKNDVCILFQSDNKLQHDVIQGVNAQNMLDFFYMFSYSALLILFLNKLKQYEHKNLNKIGILLSLNALVFDILENITLFKISHSLEINNNFDNYLDNLIIFANIKWFSLSLIFFLLILHYFKYNIIGKIFSVISVLPLILASFSFFGINKQFDAYYANSVILAFIILIIRIFVSKFAKNSISFYNHRPL
jgi:hypothetical protein